MRVLSALSYYRPYTSGLTIHAERLAAALVRRGHQVTVVASRHEDALEARECVNGVSVVRVPIAARIGKVPVMPSLVSTVWRLAAEADVLHLHLPQADGPLIAAAGRARGLPVVATSHCDARFPAGLMGGLATVASGWCDRMTAALSRRVISYTQDYAAHSRFLRRLDGRLAVVPPPVPELVVDPHARDQSRSEWGLQGRRPIIGMAARLAAEKGVDVLLGALPRVLDRFPGAVVAFAGQYEGVLGEEATRRRLEPELHRMGEAGHWRFLGTLGPQEMASFVSMLDVMVVPSLNRTESFGLVQVEAMLAGTPVVASDLPGVRQTVRTTGMGRIVPPGDAGALAAALIDVIDGPPVAEEAINELRRRHDPDQVAAEVEHIYRASARRR